MSKQSYPGASEGERAETGEKEPKGAKSSDSGGTKSKRIVNGVGMGQMDDCGRAPGGKESGEFNSGRKEGTCYTHKKG